MLQQILKDMYIDPDVLEALNEDQKKTLFIKMRQEQVRRWKEREETAEKEGGPGVRPKPRKAHCKSVSWLLGRDGDVHVCIIGEVDEFKANSKLIYPELGECKGSSVHKSTWCQSDIRKTNLVKRTAPDTARDQRENLHPTTQTGVQLNLRDNTEDLEAAAHLPPLQEPKESSDAPKSAVSLKDSGCQPNLSHRSRPLVNDKPSPLDTGGRHHLPLSITARLRPLDSQEHQNDKGAARGFRLSAASRRAGLSGAGPEGGGDQGVARGRVAQLMKNFNAPSNKLTTPHPKPPVPSKPAHLKMRPSSSLR